MIPSLRPALAASSARDGAVVPLLPPPAWFHAVFGRKCRLESLHVGTLNISSRIKYFLEGTHDLGPKPLMLGFEIDDGNSHRSVPHEDANCLRT